MTVQTILAKLERDKDGTWYFVHVPAEIRRAFKNSERRGVVAVAATIGETNWDGSLLPWADGSAQLSIGPKIRHAENLAVGQNIKVAIQLRDRQ